MADKNSASRILCNKNATDLLNIDFYVLRGVVAIKIEHQVMNKIKSIADDNERKLIGQLRFFQKVFHLKSVKQFRRKFRSQARNKNRGSGSSRIAYNR